jgi:hypothetical protein
MEIMLLFGIYFCFLAAEYFVFLKYNLYFLSDYNCHILFLWLIDNFIVSASEKEKEKVVFCTTI